MAGMKEVQAPDGTVIEFPDTMSDEAIAGVMRKQYAPRINPAEIGTDWKTARKQIDALPEYARAQAEKDYADFFVAQERKDGGILQTVDDHVRMAARNVPLAGEWSDEANALTSQASGGDYNLTLAAEHARRRAIDKEKRLGVNIPYVGNVDTGDIAKTAGFVLGAAVAPVSRFFGAGNTTRQAAGNAAATGLGYSFFDAAGAKEGNLGEKIEAGTGAGTTGALIAAPLGVAGHRIAQWAQRPRYGQRGQQAISSDDLHAAARSAYQEADNAGVILSGARMGMSGRTFPEELQHRINRTLADNAYHHQYDQRITPLVQEAQRLTGQNITFTGLEKYRQMARRVAREGTDNERRLANLVTGTMDDMMGNLEPAHILRGNAQYAVNAARQARDTWRTMRKTEIVEDAIERARSAAHATGSGGNIDNAMRQQFKQIVNNPRRSMAFDENELGAMRQVIDGNPTSNALRLLGKLSPQGNGLMLYLGAGATYSAGVPGFMAVGAGWASKGIANNRTNAAAQRVLAGVSNGNMPRYFTRFQRAINMYRQGRLDVTSLKMMTQMTAAELSKETGSEYDPLFKAMYSEAIKTAPDTSSEFKKSFPGIGG